MINQNFYLNHKKKLGNGGEARVRPRRHFLYGAHDLRNRSRGLRRKRKESETNLAANEDTRDKNNKKGTKKKIPLSAVRRRGCR
jgi:hypothetical protein